MEIQGILEIYSEHTEYFETDNYLEYRYPDFGAQYPLEGGLFENTSARQEIQYADKDELCPFQQCLNKNLNNTNSDYLSPECFGDRTSTHEEYATEDESIFLANKEEKLPPTNEEEVNLANVTTDSIHEKLPTEITAVVGEREHIEEKHFEEEDNEPTTKKDEFKNFYSNYLKKICSLFFKSNLADYESEQLGKLFFLLTKRNNLSSSLCLAITQSEKEMFQEFRSWATFYNVSRFMRTKKGVLALFGKEMIKMMSSSLDKYFLAVFKKFLIHCLQDGVISNYVQKSSQLKKKALQVAGYKAKAKKLRRELGEFQAKN